MKRVLLWTLLLSFVGVTGVWSAHATTFTSPNFSINGNLGDSAAGGQNSTSYTLTSATGESIAGQSTGTSYKLGQGYIAQLENAIELSINPPAATLGSLTPGIPVSTDLTMTILTDAPGYGIAAQNVSDLQNGATTIGGVGGSIGSPLTWANGTTKGFGFSLVNASASAIDGKWNAGSSFAAFPTTATDIYIRTGYTGGSSDTLTLRMKLDVASSQTAGAYSGQVAWTGTMTP